MDQLSFTIIKSAQTDIWINHVFGVYQDKLVTKEDRTSLTLEDMILLEGLSTRAINLCKKYVHTPQIIKSKNLIHSATIS